MQTVLFYRNYNVHFKFSNVKPQKFFLTASRAYTTLANPPIFNKYTIQKSNIAVILPINNMNKAYFKLNMIIKK